MFFFFWKVDVTINLQVKNMEMGCKYKDKLNKSGVFLAGSFEFYTVAW